MVSGFTWCKRGRAGSTLTVDGHQDGGLAFGLMAGHGGVDVGLDVVAVPPQPLSVPDQDTVSGRVFCRSSFCSAQGQREVAQRVKIRNINIE